MVTDLSLQLPLLPSWDSMGSRSAFGGHQTTNGNGGHRSGPSRTKKQRVLLPLFPGSKEGYPRHETNIEHACSERVYPKMTFQNDVHFPATEVHQPQAGGLGVVL